MVEVVLVEGRGCGAIIGDRAIGRRGDREILQAVPLRKIVDIRSPVITIGIVAGISVAIDTVNVMRVSRLSTTGRIVTTVISTMMVAVIDIASISLTAVTMTVITAIGGSMVVMMVVSGWWRARLGG